MKKNDSNRGTNFFPLKNAFISICIASILMISGTMQVTAKDAYPVDSQQSDKKVTGKVTDSSDATLPGVSVVVKGTTNGVITDSEGKFSLSNIPENAILQFTFVGMKAQQIAVGGKSNIIVKLEDESVGIEEVVAIGYGTQKKQDVTSAIAVIAAKELKKVPVANISSALQGMTPGIEVQSNQGRPGELPNVRIRGVSSTNNTEPLYIIDGVPGGAASVVASDVESMQILKDAASCAIYGSRGANGVIIITTKSGKVGGLKVSYSGYYGVEKAWKQLNLLSVPQWSQVITEVNTNGGTAIPALATDVVSGANKLWDGTETNWQNEIFKTGAIRENNLDLSGGSESGNYFFSVNSYKQDGIIIDTPFKRYSARMNSNWHSKKFKFGENFSFRFSQNENEDDNGGRSVIEELIKITPNIKVLNPTVLGGYSAYDSNIVGHDASNPVGTLMRRNNLDSYKLFTGDAFGEYEILDGLTFRTTFGFTNNEVRKEDLTLKTDMTPKTYPSTTLVNRSDWNYSWVLENRINWHKIYKGHDINVMGAYTSEYSKNSWFSATGSNLQTETNDVMRLLETGFLVDGLESELSRISYLGRVMYSYKGKYMLTANVRRDGSSKFGSGKKWGNFPSASFAWRISDEPFMQTFEKINNLKIRTSYGIVGNDGAVGTYSYLNGLTSGTNYAFSTAWATGVTLRNFNNPDLTWETVKQFDIGADIGLYKGKLEFAFDYYNKRTEDMLINFPLPGSSGSSGTIPKNIGSISNRGFEVSATLNHSIGDLHIGITANLATLKNEVLDMNNAVITAGAVEFGNATRTEKGHPIGAFYGYKTLGVFPDQASVDAYTFTNPAGVTSKIPPHSQNGEYKIYD